MPMMRCRSLLARTGFDSVLRKYDKDALAALFGLRESIEDSFTQVRRIAGVCPRLEQHFDKTTVPCPHSAVETFCVAACRLGHTNFPSSAMKNAGSSAKCFSHAVGPCCVMSRDTVATN